MEIKILEMLEKADEKILLITIIGILEALQNDVITIEESEKIVFSPYMVKELKKKGCNEKVIKIIEKGCELEDIESLLPERLNGIISEMKQEVLTCIHQYEQLDKSFRIKML